MKRIAQAKTRKEGHRSENRQKRECKTPWVIRKCCRKIQSRTMLANETGSRIQIVRTDVCMSRAAHSVLDQCANEVSGRRRNELENSVRSARFSWTRTATSSASLARPELSYNDCNSG